MSAPECRRPSRTGTCVESFADGWILATDMCPACAAAFMAALDGISGPLVWHRRYLDRVTD